MSHTEKAEQEFEAWWTCTGQHLLDKIKETLTTQPMQNGEHIFLLCRIAYFQGRIDESAKTEEQVGKMMEKAT